MLDNWQRIEQIIRWAGFPSVSAFAREIGLNRSENLYQIKRGNNGISRELAESITAKFPQLSKAWILTGEGSMLPLVAERSKSDIPFYKLDAAQVLDPAETIEPAFYIGFPLFKGCEFAALTFSDAMEPEIPRGSILFFQRSDPFSVAPGEAYFVICPQFSGIRYVRKIQDGNNLRLVPSNLARYDEIMIDCEEIEKLYLVRGIVINRSI